MRSGGLFFKVTLTHHSAAIEGNSLTLEQTRAVLQDDFKKYLSSTDMNLNFVNVLGNGVPKEDVKEVIDHGQAMEYIITKILAQRAIEENDIVLINKIVCPSAPLVNLHVKHVPEDTKYRKIPVQVRGSPLVCPYPHELPSVMKELLRIHFEKSKILHPVISACQFHNNFVRVHPFADGNGRTARLLTNIQLFSTGYVGLLILKSERSKYFSLLEAERQYDNTEYFLFMISKVEETIEAALENY